MNDNITCKIKVKKALIVASNGPEISFGGGQRNLMAIKILEAKGYLVDLIVVLNEAWGVYREDGHLIKKWKDNFGLISYFQTSFNNPYLLDNRIHKWIKKKQKEYEIIVFRDEVIAFKSGFYLLEKSKITVDMNDFLYPHIKGLKKIKYFTIHLVLKSRIKNAWVLIPNQINYFSKNVFCVPNLPLNSFNDSKQHFIKSRSSEPSILFVGSYLSELKSYLKAASNLLLSKVPNITVYIISRSVSMKDKNEYPQKNFKWLNDVEDVSGYYSKAWLSIVPGFKKDGPLIKFIESIYFETPVVATEVSMNGYECFNEKENLIPASNDTNIFTDNIVRMLKNESDLDERIRKIRLIADEKFSFNKIVNAIGF